MGTLRSFMMRAQLFVVALFALLEVINAQTTTGSVSIRQTIEVKSGLTEAEYTAGSAVKKMYECAFARCGGTSQCSAAAGVLTYKSGTSVASELDHSGHSHHRRSGDHPKIKFTMTATMTAAEGVAATILATAPSFHAALTAVKTAGFSGLTVPAASNFETTTATIGSAGIVTPSLLMALSGLIAMFLQ